MKKLLVTLLLSCSTIASAQLEPDFKSVPKSVLCGPLAAIIRGITSAEIDERPIWVGRDEESKSYYAVFVNSKTGAFTVIQFGSEIGCILGTGIKSEKF